jgi:hypothetical protein
LPSSSVPLSTGRAHGKLSPDGSLSERSMHTERVHFNHTMPGAEQLSIHLATYR